MSSKKNITTRQRGTPSPGSSQQQLNNRVSPRRTTSSNNNNNNNSNNNSSNISNNTSGNNSNNNSGNNLRALVSNSSTSTSHRRIGSGSNGNLTSTTKVRSVQSSSASSLSSSKLQQRDEISYEGNHDEFLSQSSKYQNDPADQEVLSIYLESLNPRERDSIQNFVNQQKIEAGFIVDPPMSQSSSKRGNSNYNQNKHIITTAASDIESNISDLSDTPTEVISYSNSNRQQQQQQTQSQSQSQQNGKSSSKHNNNSYNNNNNNNSNNNNRQSAYNNENGVDCPLISPRPGAQRAILEIASQMAPDEILEVIELLSITVKGQNPGSSAYSQLSQLLQQTQQNYQQTQQQQQLSSSQSQIQSNTSNNKNSHQHIPSPHTRRGKSGPPILQSSNFTINQDDEEVIQHTKHNETYRLIPPAITISSNSHGPNSSKYGRSSSAQSNGTNSAPNSLSSTPINISKKSPIPITNPFNQHDICPTVYRESHPNSRSTDVTSSQPFLTKVSSEPPLVLPKTERVESNSLTLPVQKNNNNNNNSYHSTHNSKNSSHSKEGNTTTTRNNLLESLHSPRSAFDDCSLSSSSSNFTGASTKSGRSKGSTSIAKAPSSNSSATEPISIPNNRYYR